MKSFLPVVLALASLSPSLAQAQTQTTPLTATRVVWRDARTQQELFSSADVLGYDATHYLLLLNEQKTREFARWGRKNDKFTVEDQDGVIYSASFDNSRFGNSTDAPCYQAGVPFSIRIYDLGRPSLSFRPTATEDAEAMKTFQQADLASKRLEKDLKQLGLLHALSRTPEAASDMVTLGWQKVNSRVSLWPSLYDASLQVGQSTWVSLFFSFDAAQTVKADEASQITIEVNMAANSGKFSSRTLIGPIDVPRPGTKPDIYFKFNPWKGLEGSQLPTQDGDARFSLSFLFQEKERKGLKTIARQSFEPIMILVKAPKVGTTKKP